MPPQYVAMRCGAETYKKGLRVMQGNIAPPLVASSQHTILLMNFSMWVNVNTPQVMYFGAAMYYPTSLSTDQICFMPNIAIYLLVHYLVKTGSEKTTYSQVISLLIT